MKSIPMKWFLCFILVLSCLFIGRNDAFSSETYYIDDNRVLLYKIINWWYDCIPEDSDLLCGSIIKCQSKGDTKVAYNETEMTLKLRIEGGFADLLSIFKQCDRCFGPSYLKCTWLNKKYFGSGKATIISNELPAESGFIFTNVGINLGRLVRSIEKNIVFELEGTIGGLLSGRIAMHQSGTFIKNCSAASHGPDESLSIVLKIINSRTKELLAAYSAIMEN